MSLEKIEMSEAEIESNAKIAIKKIKRDMEALGLWDSMFVDPIKRMLANSDPTGEANDAEYWLRLLLTEIESGEFTAILVFFAHYELFSIVRSLVNHALDKQEVWSKDQMLEFCEYHIERPDTERFIRIFNIALESWKTRDRDSTIIRKSASGTAHPLQDMEIVKVPNDLASVLVSKLISCRRLWETNENDCFKYVQKGNEIVSFHLDEMPDTFNEHVLQTLDARFASMKGDLVADIVDILFWHWYANGRPTYAQITLSQILKYRKKVDPSQDTIKEHWQAMRDVRSIKLRCDNVESEALFHISAVQFREDGINLKTVYRYHPGYFLSEAIQKDAFYIAYFARSIWQLDYYRDANAKRLARVLRAEWRRNPANYLPPSHPLSKTPRYRTWVALFR